MSSPTWSLRWLSVTLVAAGLSGCQCFLPVAEDSGATPEVCDGIDNDKNGRIDDGPDGEPLSRECPLTLGVCAGSHSFCLDGGWAPCDYGPNYQLTERNCDGLDNDCDGRIDVSWARLLLAPDAGGLLWDIFDPTKGMGLTAADTNAPHVLSLDGGLWVVLPNMILAADVNLTLTQRIAFPIGLNNRSYLFPNGDEWVRVTSDYEPFTSYCVEAHRVFADGGYPSVDGGVEILGRACWPKAGWHAATAVSDGWMVVATDGMNGNGDVGWAWFGRDAGMQAGLIDGGTSSTWVQTQGGRFIMTSAGRQFSELLPDSRSVVPLFAVDAGSCIAADSAPPSYSCLTTTGTIVYAMDGGQLAPPFDGLPDYSAVVSDSLFVVKVQDAGAATPTTGIVAVIIGGQLVPITELAISSWPVLWTEFHVHNVSGRLHVATYNGPVLSGVCDVCSIDGFYAEYVCAPP